MRSHEARALLFQRKLTYEDYHGTISGVPELDGQLGILELRASDTVHAEKLSKNEEGEQDEALMLAGMVAKALVMREDKERVFSDTDIEGIAGFGLSVLRPLGERIKKVSGTDEESLEAAKKNSPKITALEPHSSSHATSGAAHAKS